MRKQRAWVGIFGRESPEVAAQSRRNHTMTDRAAGTHCEHQESSTYMLPIDHGPRHLVRAEGYWFMGSLIRGFMSAETLRHGIFPVYDHVLLDLPW